MKYVRPIAIGITGLFIGILFSLQSKSFNDFNLVLERENKVNVFREIQIVKDSNQKLTDEIKSLEEQLNQTSTKEETLKNLQQEIEKDKILAGHYDVEGPGIRLNLDNELEALWFTDIVNEMFSAGAEVVSINGHILTNKNVGFDLLPDRKILLKEDILSAPYIFEAIGEPTTLYSALNQTGGIVSRIKEANANLKLQLEKVDTIKLPLILKGK